MEKFMKVVVSVLAVIVVMLIASKVVSRGWSESEVDHYTYEMDMYGEITSLSPLTYVQKYDSAVNLLSEFENLSDYIVVVDVSEQREYVFSKDGEFIDMYTVSTGATSVYVGECPDDEEECDEEDLYQDRSMGKSVWKVVSKVDSGLASMYGPRLMRLDRYLSGGWIQTLVALHGTNQPENIGTPFSLGCIYHNNADIIALYDLIDIGTFVVAID